MDLKAVTEEGKSVILHTDGTWEYSKELSTQSGAAFRKTTWGMSKEQVREIEGLGTVHESSNALIYPGSIAGLQCHIVYVFALNRLVRGKYAITEQHSNANHFLMDFESLKEALTAKYGKPQQDDMHWLDNTYRTDYQDWGLAVSMGHCSRFSKWRLSGTDIVLFLTGDNYEINLGVEYASQALSHLEDQENASRNLEDL